MQREKINYLLSERVKSNTPIQGICISSGLAAKAAEEAGADFLLTYAGAMFRREGVPASLCELCYNDCNEVTRELGRHIFPRLRKIPLIGGVSCLDPYRDIDKFIDTILAEGFSGISNMPGIGDWEGDYRTMPEQLHMGYEKEVELIQRCRRKNIFTVANCYTKEQTVWMTEAGADVICVDLGATRGGLLESASDMSVQQACDVVKETIEDILICGQPPFILFHGGPFGTVKDMGVCLGKVPVHGILGGSAVVRIPVEDAVMNTIQEIKMLGMCFGKEA